MIDRYTDIDITGAPLVPLLSSTGGGDDSDLGYEQTFDEIVWRHRRA
jgi:hypothetical protein